METKVIREIIKKLKPAFKTNDLTEFGKYLYVYNHKAIAYNGSLAIIVEVDIDEELILPIVEFEKFINRIKSKEISIDISDAVVIKAGRAKATFAKNDQMLENIRKIDFSIPTKFKELPEDFVDGLKLTRFSISKDMAMEHLIYLNIENDKMASTDNFRVSEYKMKSSMDSVQIPRETVEYLTSYDLKLYFIKNGFIYFKTLDDVIIISRVGEVEFVNYKKLFEVEGELFTFPDDAISAVDTVEITVEGMSDLDKTIQIDIHDGNIVYSSKNEVGSIETDNEIEQNIEACFFVNPLFLKQIFSITKKAIISNNLILFETDNFKQIIALFNK